MADDQSVLTERRGHTLLITLNRPDARNAVNAALANGVAAALDELDGDADLRVGVLTGAGRGFSAGMDLKAFVRGESAWVDGRGFAGIVQSPPKKPLIAAIEGFAVAGGLEVALACDLIVAAKGAKLGIPEVKRSLVAAGGALLRLPGRIGSGLAMELALTGDPISAERGAEIGDERREVVFRDEGIGPEAGKQLVLGERLRPVFDEHPQEVERLRREPDLAGACEEPPLVGVHDEVAKRDAHVKDRRDYGTLKPKRYAGSQLL